MCLGLHVNCPIILPTFTKSSISGTDFHENFEYRLHRNPCSGSRSGNVDRRTERKRVAGRRSDRQEEGNRRFKDDAKVPKIYCVPQIDNEFCF